MKPFVLLATRAEDLPADEEYSLFLRYAGLSESELIRVRLEAQIAELLDGKAALDPARLHQEAVLIAARADILSQRLAYPRKRILGWAAAHAALSACWELVEGRSITHQLACLPHLLSAYDQA